MSMSMRISRSKPLRAFQWSAAATEWADEIGPVVRDAMKAAAPVAPGPGSGRLRDSIRYERATTPGGITITWTANVPYARFVTSGTAPHLIRPRAARALHWQAAGGGRFARLVNHPGTQANPFAEHALERLLPDVQQRLQDIVETALEE